MVPVGHVMYELDRRMKTGEVPELTDIGQVYKDGIHLNNVGSYVVACTFFATLYRENPKGLTAEPYGLTDTTLAEVAAMPNGGKVSGHTMPGRRKNACGRLANSADGND